MANVKLNFLHVCDKAFLSAEGKLNIIGIFNRVGANNFPVAHPELFIVTSIKGNEGSYNEEMIIKSPTSEEIARVKEKIIIRKEESANLIASFRNIVFPLEGKYEIDIIINGKVINEENFILLTKDYDK